MDKIEKKRLELLRERNIAFQLLQNNIKDSATTTIFNAVGAGIASLQTNEKEVKEEVIYAEEKPSNIDYIIQGLTLVKQFV